MGPLGLLLAHNLTNRLDNVTTGEVVIEATVRVELVADSYPCLGNRFLSDTAEDHLMTTGQVLYLLAAFDRGHLLLCHSKSGELRLVLLLFFIYVPNATTTNDCFTSRRIFVVIRLLLLLLHCV